MSPESPLPSHEQKDTQETITTGDIFARLAEFDELEKIAHIFAKRHAIHPQDKTFSPRESFMYVQALGAFHDLHSAQQNPIQLEQFRKDWGEQAPLLEQWYESYKIQLEETSERVKTQANSWNNLTLLYQTTLAAAKVAKIATDTKRLEVLGIYDQIGTPPDIVKRRIAETLVMTAFTTYLSWTAMGVLAVWGLKHPIGPEFGYTKAMIWDLLISYTAQYGTAILNGCVISDAMQDPNVGISANIIPTIEDDLFGPFLLKHPKLRKACTVAASLSQNIFGDLTRNFEMIFIPQFPHGRTIVYYSNMAGALLSAINAISLKTFQIYKNAKIRRAT